LRIAPKRSLSKKMNEYSFIFLQQHHAIHFVEGEQSKTSKQHMLEYPFHESVRNYESKIFIELDMLHYISKRQEPLLEVESQPMQINVATWQ
jgi:hypothetical protein